MGSPASPLYISNGKNLFFQLARIFNREIVCSIAFYVFPSFLLGLILLAKNFFFYFYCNSFLSRYWHGSFSNGIPVSEIPCAQPRRTLFSLFIWCEDSLNPAFFSTISRIQY